jgi:hypothetical protein
MFAVKREIVPEDELAVPGSTLIQQPQAAFTESCPASGIVAFSVVGENHVSSGGLTLSVSLLLEAGDDVQTFVTSDGGSTRHLARYNFTGHLVKPY